MIKSDCSWNILETHELCVSSWTWPPSLFVITCKFVQADNMNIAMADNADAAETAVSTIISSKNTQSTRFFTCL